MIIKRSIQSTLESWLFRNKVIILYGARQVGKTTLVRALLETYGEKGAYFNCEVQTIREALSVEEPILLKKYLGDKKIVVFDEAQQIRNIGRVLKLLHDHYPEIQIIATGSSSFDLANRTNEPLTGRALQFTLYPLSYGELAELYSPLERKALLEKFLIYGMYPEIVQSGEGNAKVLLDELSNRYLYKDVLEFENLKRSDIIYKLLQLLALQIGNEVKLNELASTLQTHRRTIERYIDLLEKAFVIFRLRSFSRNLRKEISKAYKVYFYDVGIRNSIVQQYQALDLRTDKGNLWENFLISERLKTLQRHQIRPNLYFWRTHDKSEIDFLEEYGGKLTGYEFKWKAKRHKIPRLFLETYPNSSVQVVDQDNFEDFWV